MIECYRNHFFCNGLQTKCKLFDGTVFLRGTPVYEVFRAVNGVPLFFEKHLERLANSLKYTGLKPLLTTDELTSQVQQLFQVNEIFDGNVKIVYHYDNQVNTALVYFTEHYYPTPEQYRYGVATELYQIERQNPNAKVFNQQLRLIANQFKSEKKIHELILVDKNGFITEGSRSNLFMIQGDTVFTSPVSEVLPGVTRDGVIQLCKTLNINLVERKVSQQELLKMDALFLSSTSNRVLPIYCVGNYKFSTDNHLLIRLRDEFDNLVERYLTQTTV